MSDPISTETLTYFWTVIDVDAPETGGADAVLWEGTRRAVPAVGESFLLARTHYVETVSVEPDLGPGLPMPSVTIGVRIKAMPRIAGDGVTDDTAALQAVADRQDNAW